MNDNQSDAGDRRAAIEDEAVAWFIRLRGEDAEGLRPEFDAWIAASPEHRRAYEWAKGHFGASEILKSDHRRSRNRKIWLAVGAAAAAAVVFVAFGANGVPATNPMQGRTLATRADEPLTTRRGEIRSFRLADGSTATLDTDSKVEVAMTETERRLRLSRGRARFEVAQDPRPFRVEAGVGEVTAREAVFDVAFDDRQQIMVQLIHGEADVRPVPRHAVYIAPPRSLTQGGLFAYRASDYAMIPSWPEATRRSRSEWPSGWVEYRLIRLDRLVTQANRYTYVPIILDDAATAGLQVSGRFRISDTDNFVERIAELFDLSVTRQAEGVHLRKR